MSTQRGSRVASLDGLRGIAVLAVLGFHLGLKNTFLEAGELGVDVFFVLSGYLITRILLRNIKTTGDIDFRRFYIHRSIRLVPALITVAGVGTLVCAILVPTRIEGFAVDALLAIFYLTPVSLALHYSHAWVHTWTLSAEEYFYLCFPAVVTVIVLKLKCSTRTTGFILLIIAILESATLYFLTASDFATPSWALNYLRTAGIAGGCAFACLVDGRAPKLDRWKTWLLSTAAVILFAAAITASHPWAGRGLSYIAADAATVLIVVVCVYAEGLGPEPLLRLRPLVFFGAISYELYLWHHVLRTIGSWWTGQDFAVVALVAYPLAVILAFGTHIATRPLQGRLKRWTSRTTYPRQSRGTMHHGST